MKAVHHELIKQRAHAIWEQNGRPHGQDKEHWEQAERELLDAAPAIEAKAPAKPVAENDLGAAVEDALATAPDQEILSGKQSSSLPPAGLGHAARRRQSRAGNHSPSLMLGRPPE